ncbi:MAG: peptidylprolyl isomerase [Pseudomonadota bacterium]
MRIGSGALRSLIVALTLLGFAVTATAAESASSSRPQVRIETSVGNIDVELFPQQAPESVANFLQLVDDGFYKGTIFHRVIANFVIQTGGYDAKLAYREPPRTVINEAKNGLKNQRGWLAMARRDDPDSADAQFFINMRTNPHLDPGPGSAGYTVFGRVIAGMQHAERIELADTGIRNGMAGVPLEAVEIISTTQLKPGPPASE